MRTHVRNSDGARSPFAQPSRSPSISSLGSPTSARFVLAQPPQTKIPPAYVAAAAASDIVTGLHHSPIRDPRPDLDRVAYFNEDALGSINNFLDFLLYNMLAVARSSALDPVRSAVEHVVKGKLAQQAIRSGELELEELLNDEDEDELLSMRHGLDAEAQHWDADMVWKRSRMKIFTMMRLSEVEDDDDDDEYDEGEEMHSVSVQRGAGLVSWPAMIFLTGALERIGEQCVIDAGDSAYNRASMSRPGTRDGSYDDDEDVIVVRDQDAKKIALSQLVGRIWRTWKHTLPRGSPRVSQASGRQYSHERGASVMSEITYSRRPSYALQPITDHSRDDLLKESSRDSAQEQDEEIAPNGQALRATESTVDQPTALVKQQRHAPRRSRSFGRFPVVVSGRSDAGSWLSQRGEAMVEQELHRMRSSSLPPPSVQNVPPVVAKQTQDNVIAANPSTKRRSREVSDVAAEAAKAAPQAAEATLAARSSKRSSRSSNKRRSKEVRHSREITNDAPSHDFEPPQKAPNTAKALPSAPATASPSGPSDDDYDPFRADATTPPPVMSSRAEPMEHVAAQAPPIQDTLRKMHERSSMSPSPQPGTEADMAAALADGAISTAMFGTTSQQRRTRKPAPLDMSNAGPNESRSTNTDARLQQHDRTPSEGHHARAISMVSKEAKVRDFSPGQTSGGRVDSDSRTPSSSKLHRMGTSDTGSAPYHTPRGSPTTFEERPGPQAPTSDPASTVTGAAASSPKYQRSTGSTASRTSNKAPVMRDTDKGANMGSRSDKEFYELMSGNETVKRSLTPKTLTDIEVRKSPLTYHPTHADPHAQAADSSTLRQQQIKSAYGPPSPMATQFPIPEPSDSADISSAEVVTSPAKKASNIGAIRKAAEEARFGEAGSASSSRPPRSPHTARDAREQPYRTNDMADFIRSTAPGSPEQAPKLVSPSSTSPTGHGSKPTSAYSKPAVPSMKSVVPNTSRTAQKKLMRPAKMERQANDDLISFLNQGPPGAQVNKSKSMETTNSRANEGVGLGQLSPANRSSSQMSQSINESVASHSALLPKTSDRSPMMNASAPRSAPLPKTTGEGGMPQRRQKRSKDPYAIESDDENNDVLTGLPPKDEPSDSMSLADFLRSTAPPEDNKPSSLASSASAKRLTTSPPAPGGRNRLTSPPRGKRASASPFGTSSTAVGGPGPKLHKTIPSNEEIKRDPGDLALPQFLKEDRQLRPRDSYDNESPARKGRSSSKDAGKAGMRGLFKRIGVNG